MLSNFIIKVGCKRIIAIMVVGTWSASQLLRIGAVLVGDPMLASAIGVSSDFASLAYFTAGTYLGYSVHKNGVKASV